MGPEQRLRTAISQVYRAAVQPDPLRIWAKTISDLVKGPMANLTVMAPSGAAAASVSIGFKTGADAEFLHHYQHLSPFWKLWRTRTPGQIVHLSGLIDGDFKRTEYYSDYWRHLDIGDGLCMAVRGDATTNVICTVCRSEKGDIGPTEHDLLKSLYGDLSSSFEMASTLAQARSFKASMIDGFDQIGVGVAVLSEDGRVEDANSRMREVMNSGNVLKSRHGRLIVGTSNLFPGLPALVRRASVGNVGGARLRYNSPSGEHGTLLAFSASNAVDWRSAGETKVILLVTDGERQASLPIETLRKTYRLTMAEARIAGLLMDGKTTRLMASELNVRINTVRAHLKAVYAKTGTHSQVELLSLLQRHGAQGRL